MPELLRKQGSATPLDPGVEETVTRIESEGGGDFPTRRTEYGRFPLYCFALRLRLHSGTAR